MRIAFVALAIVALPAYAGDNHVLRERVAYWQAALSQGVPTGTAKDKAVEWGASHNVQFEYLVQQHWLYANVEQVKESGIPFPCSQWNIILKVTIDASGRSSKNEVTTVGSCL